MLNKIGFVSALFSGRVLIFDRNERISEINDLEIILYCDFIP